MRVNHAGFNWNSRTKVAHFEAIVPGTGGLKRRRKTVHGVTQAEALRQWREFRDGVLAGRKEPDTFAAYIDRYGSNLLARLSPKSAEKEASRVRRVLMPFFGAVPLTGINLALVKDFVSHLKQDGYEERLPDGGVVRHPYSPASINDALSVLRKVLWDAVAREEIARYPIVGGALPRQKEPVLRQELSPVERDEFLAAFNDEQGFRNLISEQGARSRESRLGAAPSRSASRIHGGGRTPSGGAVGYHFQRFQASRAFFVVAIETGLRKGDLLNLRWSNVHLKEGWIRVAMQKTGFEATVPISSACAEALRDCRRRAVVGEYVFLNESNRPLPEIAVKRYFRIAKRLAGITRPFRFHDLRHTFASTLASEGVSQQVIARALGHTSTRMTDRYARPSDEAMRSIASALDRSRVNSPVNWGAESSATEEPPTPFVMNGLPGEIRTPDPRLRRPMLLSS
jgi:integrase